MSLCTAEEQEAFQENCKLPVFREAWNQWVVAAAEGEDEDDVKEAFAYWIRNTDGVEADHLELTLLPNKYDDLAGIDDTLQTAVLPSGRKALKETACTKGDIVPNLRKGDEWSLWFVRFVARGPRETMSWPVYSEGFPVGFWCPLDTLVQVERAFAPDRAAPIPEPPKSISDKLKDLGDTVTSPAGLTVGALVVVAVATLLVLRR